MTLSGAEAHIETGEEVAVRAVDGKLLVTPVRFVRGRLPLTDLIASIPAGAPVHEGDEV